MAIELGTGLLGLGAGLAIGLGAIGTGIAQQQGIAAALGAVAEDPKMLGKSMLFVLLPESLVIFGLVIAAILIGNI